MGQIDQQQYTKQVEKTSSTDVTMGDSFSSLSLSSSILSAMGLGLGFGTYGICDSLTMTKQKQTVRLCGDDEDIGNTVTMDEEEDEIDAAWREFDCSWEDVNVKKNEKDMPKLSVSPSRGRSGVRRGHHDGSTTGPSIKMISVPTKCIDGPSSAIRKQSIPRAA
jgi:hypothetical protein